MNLQELPQNLYLAEGLMPRCRTSMIQSSFPNWQFVLDVVITFLCVISLTCLGDNKVRRTSSTHNVGLSTEYGTISVDRESNDKEPRERV